MIQGTAKWNSYLDFMSLFMHVMKNELTDWWCSHQKGRTTISSARLNKTLHTCWQNVSDTAEYPVKNRMLAIHISKAKGFNKACSKPSKETTHAHVNHKPSFICFGFFFPLHLDEIKTQWCIHPPQHQTVICVKAELLLSGSCHQVTRWNSTHPILHLLMSSAAITENQKLLPTH